MLNGYRSQLSNHHQDGGGYDVPGTGADGLKIATLCNLGNTCFLNSVLYTLRFAPSFLHNLHHLATDLSNLNDKQLQTKVSAATYELLATCFALRKDDILILGYVVWYMLGTWTSLGIFDSFHLIHFLDQAKSSSLGRTGVSLTSSSSRSWSSKDLLALAGPTANEATKPRIQIATERLHELFMALRVSEARENSEPYQPDAFLQALRSVLCRKVSSNVLIFIDACHVHAFRFVDSTER